MDQASCKIGLQGREQGTRDFCKTVGKYLAVTRPDASSKKSLGAKMDEYAEYLKRLDDGEDDEELPPYEKDDPRKGDNEHQETTREAAAMNLVPEFEEMDLTGCDTEERGGEEGGWGGEVGQTGIVLIRKGANWPGFSLSLTKILAWLGRISGETLYLCTMGDWDLSVLDGMVLWILRMSSVFVSLMSWAVDALDTPQNSLKYGIQNTAQLLQ